MKILVDIEDDYYTMIKKIRVCHYTARIYKAVQDGVVIPSGHKIIDATELQCTLAKIPMEDRTFREAVEVIDDYPSINEVGK